MNSDVSGHVWVVFPFDGQTTGAGPHINGFCDCVVHFFRWEIGCVVFDPVGKFLRKLQVEIIGQLLVLTESSLELTDFSADLRGEENGCTWANASYNSEQELKEEKLLQVRKLKGPQRPSNFVTLTEN